MKLPTLNVDVAVNTSSMKKDVARANKEIQQIGGKALAFTGGMGGKFGALGSLGGFAGTGAIGIGAIAAGIGLLSSAQDSFLSSLKEADSAVKSFAETGKTGGMNIVAARILSQQSAQMDELSKRGLFGGVTESLFATAATGQGNVLTEFIDVIRSALNFGAGIAGGAIANKTTGEIFYGAAAQAAPTQGLAQLFAGMGQGNDMASVMRYMAEEMARSRKDQREANT